jgi:hypothetical protein
MDNHDCIGLFRSVFITHLIVLTFLRYSKLITSVSLPFFKPTLLLVEFQVLVRHLNVFACVDCFIILLKLTLLLVNSQLKTPVASQTSTVLFINNIYLNFVIIGDAVEILFLSSMSYNIDFMT